MSAFNWIVFSARCPKCHIDTTIKAQCHVASSFRGDEYGRFCDNEYRLGEKMRWWPQEKDATYSWISEDAVKVTDDSVQECCYSKCCNCQTSLYAIITFLDITPIAIDEIGLEINWPDGYYK